MHLLSAKNGVFELHEFSGDAIPSYAILSHTWKSDSEEVTYKDIMAKVATSKSGYSKLKFCAEKALMHGLTYFWVDSCCIDKSSSAELQEAINSMFDWYRMAARCYVYLLDVSTDVSDLNALPSQSRWESAFRKSRWFTRGWTLQELLAPKSVEFFSQEGLRLGDKRSLENQIHEITSIPLDALRGAKMSEYSVTERMSWAQQRQTKREEDWAYSLLGIFGIVIPLLYGEGKERATARLKREIKETMQGADLNHGFLDNITSISFNPVRDGTHSQTPATMTKFNKTHSGPENPDQTHKIGISPQVLEAEENEANNHKVSHLPKLRTHDGLQSWIQTFRKRSSDSNQSPPKEDSKAGFASIRKLIQRKGTLPQPPALLQDRAFPTTGISAFRSAPSVQPKQLISPSLLKFVKHSIPNDQVHVIIQGLGASGGEIRERMFPRDGTVDMIHEYLEYEGFGRLSGFKVFTMRDSYYISRTTPKSTLTAIEITDGPSQNDIRNGYAINLNERLIDFYNNRFPATLQMAVDAGLDYVNLIDNHDATNRVSVDMKRIHRVPDDGKTYELPQPQASFPLFVARHFSSTLPEPMVEKGGLFFPMLQREALTLAFSSETTTVNQFAVRIFTGGVNALTGQSALEDPSSSNAQQQDYIVVPQQGLLSGYRCGDIVKQFVAMPMGDRYSVEYQLTGEEYIGGIQLEVIPKLRQSAVFSQLPPYPFSNMAPEPKNLDLFNCPEELGLRPGQRISMLDKSPEGLYEFPTTTLKSAKDFVEPVMTSRGYSLRPTLIRELYDGPSFERMDLSSTLIISAVQPVEMHINPPGANKIMVFYCSHSCRMRDIGHFLRPHLIDRHLKGYYSEPPKVILTMAGKSYDEDDDTVIGDLNLSSPQRINFEITMLSRLIGGLPDEGEVSRGWDMSIAMGGNLKQNIIRDETPQIWNWKSSRIINFQILNTVAFQTVTGLYPPFSPPILPLASIAGLPTTPEPPTVTKSIAIKEQLKHVKSIKELDWERGAAPGVVVNGDSVVVCVCCEMNICNTIFPECGHMFCQICIAYYMTENTIITCGFCHTISDEVVQFGALAPAFEELDNNQKHSIGQRATARDRASSNIDVGDSDFRYDMLQSLLDGGVDTNKFVDAIYRTDPEMRRSTMCQLLLGQTMAKTDLLAKLPIGRLVYEALYYKNRLALQLLLPLYEVVNHPGLHFARDHDIDISNAMSAIADLFALPNWASSKDINTIVLKFGLQTAQLLVQLEIFPLEFEADHVRTVMQDNHTGELQLLLSFGMDAACADHEGVTTLHIVTSADVAELLCNAGASIASVDGEGNTPILMAAIYRRNGVLEVLLKQDGVGDCINHRNHFGKAAVHYVQSKPELLKMLIDAGADPALEVGPVTEGAIDWTRPIR